MSNTVKNVTLQDILEPLEAQGFTFEQETDPNLRLQRVGFLVYGGKRAEVKNVIVPQQGSSLVLYRQAWSDAIAFLER